MTEAYLEEIKARSGKATPGLQVWADEGDHWSICSEHDDLEVGHVCIASVSYNNPNADNDAKFLGKAQSDIDNLTAFVEKCVAVIKEQQIRLDSLFNLYAAKTYSRDSQSDLDLILASGKELLTEYHAKPESGK